MGIEQSIMKVNFEDIKQIENNNNFLLINTLPSNDQTCLIKGTIPINNEEEIINKNLKNNKINIIIYGKNSNDDKIFKKYKQLISLGFSKVYIYPGGLFEWLCLQDIYGKFEFSTIGNELDILKYKAKSMIT